MDLIGRALGKYHILEELDRGDIKVTYKGYDALLDRYATIEVLLPALTQQPDFTNELVRKARSAAGLQHPNIATIYEIGEHGGLYYLATEYLSERPLSQIIREYGLLPLPETLHIVEQVASALDYAHEQGLVHQDVNSSNILVDEKGQVVLTGFEIAYGVWGTPEYMAPERAQGGQSTASSDLYALGVVVYEMLTGRVPFQAPTAEAVLVKQVTETPPPLRAWNPGVPEGVERAILRALAKKPRKRPSNAAAFITALRTEAGLPTAPPPPLQPTPARPTRRLHVPKWAWALIGVALVLVPVLLGVLIASNQARGQAIAQMTATAEVRKTATAVARRTANAAARFTATAEAQATAAAFQATSTAAARRGTVILPLVYVPPR